MFTALCGCLVLAAGQAAADTYVLRDLGIKGDGITDTTERIRRLLDKIGEHPATIEVTQGTYAVSSLVFPEQITLSFRNGGQLAVMQDSQVEIKGMIEAGPTPVFSGDGRIVGAARVLHVFPQWFGARGDGIQDDGPALQQAADLAATTLGRTLFIPDGEYRFDRDVVFRCNVECRGLLIKAIEIDESRTQFSHDLFLPTHYPRNNPTLLFEPDHPLQELTAEVFFGIQEGDMKIPAFKEVPLADGSGTATLVSGGTLILFSSDFFSSRNVRKGAHYYERNDICQIVTDLGDVFPEFAFSYEAPPQAPPWEPGKTYVKGDYCTHEGAVFKATYTSGPGAVFRHRHFGQIEISPTPPNADTMETYFAYAYEDGTADSIQVWLKTETKVWYRPKDVPLTVNGLRMEVRLLNHGGETKRIAAGAVNVMRSNMTFNNLEITVRDREATLSQLLSSSRCVNVEFNNGFFSGATSAHLGYNILNSNVANFRYNHCISTNSRKGMDGRHGKNITVNGGHYNVINDHYGRNYTIRDVTLSGLSVFVPNDSTPKADLQGWEFMSREALGFNGANFYLENITVTGAQAGILSARSDIGDLYGDVVLRNISIRGNIGDVQVFSHRIAEGFDYAHEVKSPRRLAIENISLENPGRMRFVLGSGFGERPYGPVSIKSTGPIGHVFTASPETHFMDSVFMDCTFQTAAPARVYLRNGVFYGSNKGLDNEQIGAASGNLAAENAVVEFPLDYTNRDMYPPIKPAPRRSSRSRR